MWGIKRSVDDAQYGLRAKKIRESANERMDGRAHMHVRTLQDRIGRLTYAMIHRVVSQRGCAQRGCDIEFSRPPVHGLDHDWKAVGQAFTPEKTLGL